MINSTHINESLFRDFGFRGREYDGEMNVIVGK